MKASTGQAYPTCQVKGDIGSIRPHRIALDYSVRRARKCLGLSAFPTTWFVKAQGLQSSLNRLNAFQDIFGKRHVEAVDIHL